MSIITGTVFWVICTIGGLTGEPAYSVGSLIMLYLLCKQIEEKKGEDDPG